MIVQTDNPAWVPKTSEDFVSRAQTWDRQCRKFRDGALTENLYPIARKVAFESRQKARKMVRE